MNQFSHVIHRSIEVGLSLFAVSSVAGQAAFQPYSAQGDNLIHVATFDYDGVGHQDYVVAMSVSGKVIAFNRPAAITDPTADNRLWEYSGGPSMGIMIATGEAISSSPGNEILLPGTDGHLRILSRDGVLLRDWVLEGGTNPGPLYSVDTGVNAAGAIRIVAGGVDGRVYILDETGTTLPQSKTALSSSRPPKWGVIRRVVVGNFDGTAGDEVMAFYNQKNFSGGTYFHPTDLTTLAVPSYWGATAATNDDVAKAPLGWTDKQLPSAYDMDGDGDEEIVAHWGVLHPEAGYGTGLLSTMLTDGERLRLTGEYTNVFEETNTGKYLLQQGVPGDFKDGVSYPGPEMLTIYGDDLYLVDYDATAVAAQRFRVTDYGYAHTLYHFSDAARLEDRNGSLDKVVVTGPINGDDRFYVIDLSGDQWKTDAKTIDSGGVLSTVRGTLDTLKSDLKPFEGTVAPAGDPIWLVHYFASNLGWPMTPANIASRAAGVAAAMQEWSDRIGGTTGYTPQRIHLAASLNSTIIGSQTYDDDLTEEGIVAYCAELARIGVRFCLTIGAGNNVGMSPENLADCFEASVVDGVCYMMARTKELKEADYIDLYKPHLDAVLARAASLGVAPPRIMLCGKGAIFSALSPTQAATYFPAYKDILVPGVENSNVTVLEWSFAERVGLWLNGDVESWGCNPIGDNLAANRVAEWGGMRNGHVVLRQMLSQYAMGAEIFRITSISNQDNPMYLRGDISAPELAADPDLAWSNPYRLGILNFLRIVEFGVFPNSPDRSLLKGISPVAAALESPNFTRLRDQSINHDYKDYVVQPQDYVINKLACWYAYTDLPDVDLSSILHGSQRRWDNLLPTSPSGFVPIIPYATRAAVEAKTWNERTFETDGDSWDEFGTLTAARDAIAAELTAQRTNLLFYPEGDCFWQVAQADGDPETLFAVLMDSNTLTPTARSVMLKHGSASGAWEVFDQFGSQSTPLGILYRSTDAVSIAIPAGGVRFLTLRRKDLSYTGWAVDNGLSGLDAIESEDTDKDGLDNLKEFALGGDPNTVELISIRPTATTTTVSETDYTAFTYRRRTDWAERNLSYAVETSPDLLPDSWTSDGTFEFLITPIDVDFEFVTTHTAETGPDPHFIRLRVESTASP